MSIFHLLPTRLQIRLGRFKCNLEALWASLQNSGWPPYHRCLGRRLGRRFNPRREAAGDVTPSQPNAKPARPAKARPQTTPEAGPEPTVRFEKMIAALPEVEKGAVFDVTFLPSGKTIRIGEDQTLLDAGLAAGFTLPFSCTAGGCAACRVKLVSGKVEMDPPNCLTDEEIAEGYCLLCVGHPRSALVLDITCSVEDS